MHHPSLILVEGLPGTGKTTRAAHVADFLRAEGQSVVLYQEGDLQPCDHQWISRMSPETFAAARVQLEHAWIGSPQSESWEAIANRIQMHSEDEEGEILTAYTRLSFADRDLWDAMQPFRDAEIHDGRVSPQRYRDIYLHRWQEFGASASADTITIMECAFLQCHVTELLGYHGANATDILDFLDQLLEPVRHLRPSVHYISAEDYPSCIRATAATRPGWLDSVIAWVESSPYGRAHRLAGFDGAMAFFTHRAAIEQRALTELGLDVRHIHR